MFNGSNCVCLSEVRKCDLLMGWSSHCLISKGSNFEEICMVPNHLCLGTDDL